MQTQFLSNRGAFFSPDRKHRYLLWRRWESYKPSALFIGLNPSTADEHEDDPTIRRCRGFAENWGCGALFMVNLFAYRATQPKDMLQAADPVGADNDTWLKAAADWSEIIVCAWGAHGAHQGRDKHVLALLAKQELKCLGTTKHGHPRHPLYIPASQPLEPYSNNI